MTRLWSIAIIGEEQRSGGVDLENLSKDHGIKHASPELLLMPLYQIAQRSLFPVRFLVADRARIISRQRQRRRRRRAVLDHPGGNKALAVYAPFKKEPLRVLLKPAEKSSPSLVGREHDIPINNLKEPPWVVSPSSSLADPGVCYDYPQVEGLAPTVFLESEPPCAAVAAAAGSDVPGPLSTPMGPAAALTEERLYIGSQLNEDQSILFWKTLSMTQSLGMLMLFLVLLMDYFVFRRRQRRRRPKQQQQFMFGGNFGFIYSCFHAALSNKDTFDRKKNEDVDDDDEFASQSSYGSIPRAISLSLSEHGSFSTTGGGGGHHDHWQYPHQSRDSLSIDSSEHSSPVRSPCRVSRLCLSTLKYELQFHHQEASAANNEEDSVDLADERNTTTWRQVQALIAGQSPCRPRRVSLLSLQSLREEEEEEDDDDDDDEPDNDGASHDSSLTHPSWHSSSYHKEGEDDDDDKLETASLEVQRPRSSLTPRPLLSSMHHHHDEDDFSDQEDSVVLPLTTAAVSSSRSAAKKYNKCSKVLQHRVACLYLGNILFENNEGGSREDWESTVTQYDSSSEDSELSSLTEEGSTSTLESMEEESTTSTSGSACLTGGLLHICDNNGFHSKEDNEGSVDTVVLESQEQQPEESPQQPPVSHILVALMEGKREEGTEEWECNEDSPSEDFSALTEEESTVTRWSTEDSSRCLTDDCWWDRKATAPVIAYKEGEMLVPHEIHVSVKTQTLGRSMSLHSPTTAFDISWVEQGKESSASSEPKSDAKMLQDNQGKAKMPCSPLQIGVEAEVKVDPESDDELSQALIQLYRVRHSEVSSSGREPVIIANDCQESQGTTVYKDEGSLAGRESIRCSTGQSLKGSFREVPVRIEALQLSSNCSARSKAISTSSQSPTTIEIAYVRQDKRALALAQQTGTKDQKEAKNSDCPLEVEVELDVAPQSNEKSQAFADYQVRRSEASSSCGLPVTSTGSESTTTLEIICVRQNKKSLALSQETEPKDQEEATRIGCPSVVGLELDVDPQSDKKSQTLAEYEVRCSEASSSSGIPLSIANDCQNSQGTRACENEETFRSFSPSLCGPLDEKGAGGIGALELSNDWSARTKALSTSSQSSTMPEIACVRQYKEWLALNQETKAKAKKSPCPLEVELSVAPHSDAKSQALAEYQVRHFEASSSHRMSLTMTNAYQESQGTKAYENEVTMPAQQSTKCAGASLRGVLQQECAVGIEASELWNKCSARSRALSTSSPSPTMPEITSVRQYKGWLALNQQKEPKVKKSLCQLEDEVELNVAPHSAEKSQALAEYQFRHFEGSSPHRMSLTMTDAYQESRGTKAYENEVTLPAQQSTECAGASLRGSLQEECAVGIEALELWTNCSARSRALRTSSQSPTMPEITSVRHYQELVALNQQTEPKVKKSPCPLEDKVELDVAPQSDKKLAEYQVRCSEASTSCELFVTMTNVREKSQGTKASGREQTFAIQAGKHFDPYPRGFLQEECAVGIGAFEPSTTCSVRSKAATEQQSIICLPSGTPEIIRSKRATASQQQIESNKAEDEKTTEKSQCSLGGDDAVLKRTLMKSLVEKVGIFVDGEGLLESPEKCSQGACIVDDASASETPVLPSIKCNKESSNSAGVATSCDVGGGVQMTAFTGLSEWDQHEDVVQLSANTMKRSPSCPALVYPSMGAAHSLERAEGAMSGSSMAASINGSIKTVGSHHIIVVRRRASYQEIAIPQAPLVPTSTANKADEIKMPQCPSQLEVVQQLESLGEESLRSLDKGISCGIMDRIDTVCHAGHGRVSENDDMLAARRSIKRSSLRFKEVGFEASSAMSPALGASFQSSAALGQTVKAHEKATALQQHIELIPADNQKTKETPRCLLGGDEPPLQSLLIQVARNVEGESPCVQLDCIGGDCSSQAIAIESEKALVSQQPITLPSPVFNNESYNREGGATDVALLGRVQAEGMAFTAVRALALQEGTITLSDAVSARRGMNRSHSCPTVLGFSTEYIWSDESALHSLKESVHVHIQKRPEQGSISVVGSHHLVVRRRRASHQEISTFRRVTFVPDLTPKEFSLMVSSFKKRRKRRASMPAIPSSSGGKKKAAAATRRLSYQELATRYRSLEDSFHGSSNWTSLRGSLSIPSVVSPRMLVHLSDILGGNSYDETDGVRSQTASSDGFRTTPEAAYKASRPSMMFSSPLALQMEENSTRKGGNKESPTSVRDLLLEPVGLDVQNGDTFSNSSCTFDDSYNDSGHLLSLPMFATTRSSVQTNTDVMDLSYRLLGAGDSEEFEEKVEDQGEKHEVPIMSNSNRLRKAGSPPKVDDKCVSSSHRRKLKNARLVVRVVLGPHRQDYKTSVACFGALDIVTSFRKELHDIIQELSKGHHVLSSVKHIWSTLWLCRSDPKMLDALSFPRLNLEKELDEYEYCVLLVQKIYQHVRPRVQQDEMPGSYAEIGCVPNSESDDMMTLFLDSIGCSLPVSLPLEFPDSDKYKRKRLTPYEPDQHYPLSLQDALRVVRSVLGPSHNKKRVASQDCLRAIQIYGLLKIQAKKLSGRLEAQVSFFEALNKNLERLLDALDEKVATGAQDTTMEIGSELMRISGTHDERQLSASMDMQMMFMATQVERIGELLLDEGES